MKKDQKRSSDNRGFSGNRDGERRDDRGSDNKRSFGGGERRSFGGNSGGERRGSGGGFNRGGSGGFGGDRNRDGAQKSFGDNRGFGSNRDGDRRDDRGSDNKRSFGGGERRSFGGNSGGERRGSGGGFNRGGSGGFGGDRNRDGAQKSFGDNRGFGSNRDGDRRDDRGSDNKRSFGGGERRSFGGNSGGERRGSGGGFNRGGSGGFGGDRNRDGAQKSFGDNRGFGSNRDGDRRDDRGSDNKHSFGGGERRSFGGNSGGERRGSGGGFNRGGSGGFGGDRNRDGAQKSFGDNRGFGGNRDGDRRDDRGSDNKRSFGGGERRSFGGNSGGERRGSGGGFNRGGSGGFAGNKRFGDNKGFAGDRNRDSNNDKRDNDNKHYDNTNNDKFNGERKRSNLNVEDEFFGNNKPLNHEISDENNVSVEDLNNLDTVENYQDDEFNQASSKNNSTGDDFFSSSVNPNSHSDDNSNYTPTNLDKKKNNETSSTFIIKMEDLLELFEKNTLSVDQIIKHFKLKLSDTDDVLDLLDKLVSYNIVKKFGSKSYKLRLDSIKNTKIPEYALLTISGNNSLGEKIAKFSETMVTQLNLKDFTIFVDRVSHNLNINDHIISQLKVINKTTLVAKVLKYLPNVSNTNFVVGVVTSYNEQYFLIPLGRRYKQNFLLDLNNQTVTDKALVKAEVSGSSYNPKAILKEIISERDLSSELSLLTAHEYDLQIVFSEEAIIEAEAKGSPSLDGRIDIRDLPLVTIDGEDAKDFDDAVFVEKLAENGKYRALIAIADVSSYVEENSVLDSEAKARGNSVYLPGLVIPMLPEVLSNGWCSLNPNVDRACFVADLVINTSGLIENFKFYKAIMNSKARLTYNEVEDALNGKVVDKLVPLMDKVVYPLNDCWKILNQAKIKRSALEIESNEYKVDFNEDNSVKSISLRERLSSHQIIEELMIAANVASAMFLKQHGLNSKHLVTYRVHDRPSLKKVETLKAMLKSLDIKTDVPTVLSTKFFNDLINHYKETEIFPALNEITLMSQSQAKYDTYNIGHFGLALTDYCHFTSPIRRYADLTIHRLIAKVLNDKSIKLTKEESLAAAEHISATERNASSAEYSAVEKITAKFLEDKINSTFSARISSITNAGIFITLSDLGASGLVPMRTLGNERFNFIDGMQKIVGRNTKKSYKIGQKLQVILTEVNILKGLLTFEIK